MIKITLPFPVSTNHYWAFRKMKSGIRAYISAKGKAFRKEVSYIVALNRLNNDINERLKVSIELFPPDNRKRDLDNFAGKSLLDALTYSKLWKDDSLIDELNVKRGPVVKNGKCIVIVEVING